MKMIKGVEIELHADDYGQTINISTDILNLMREGKLDGISILPNMPCFAQCSDMIKDAVRNKELPFLPRMSIHLDLVEGILLSTGEINPWTWKKLFLVSYHLGGSGASYSRVYDFLKVEIKAQLSAVQSLINELQSLAEENGVSYVPQKFRIDSHQHAHMVPIVWKALVAVIEEEGYEVEYIRNSHEPLSLFLNKKGCNWRKVNIVKNLILAFYAPSIEKYSAKLGIPKMYLWGLIMSGHMDMERIRKIMPDMIDYCAQRKASLELNIHPGLMLESEICPEIPVPSWKEFLIKDDRKIENETAQKFHDYLQELG